MLNYAPIDRVMAEVGTSGMISSINIIIQASHLARDTKTRFLSSIKAIIMTNPIAMKDDEIIRMSDGSVKKVIVK